MIAVLNGMHFVDKLAVGILIALLIVWVLVWFSESW